MMSVTAINYGVLNDRLLYESDPQHRTHKKRGCKNQQHLRQSCPFAPAKQPFTTKNQTRLRNRRDWNRSRSREANHQIVSIPFIYSNYDDHSVVLSVLPLSTAMTPPLDVVDLFSVTRCSVWTRCYIIVHIESLLGWHQRKAGQQISSCLSRISFLWLSLMARCLQPVHVVTWSRVQIKKNGDKAVIKK